MFDNLSHYHTHSFIWLNSSHIEQCTSVTTHQIFIRCISRITCIERCVLISLHTLIRSNFQHLWSVSQAEHLHLISSSCNDCIFWIMAKLCWEYKCTSLLRYLWLLLIFIDPIWIFLGFYSLSNPIATVDQFLCLNPLRFDYLSYR